jgi:hypothetical protein
VKNSPRYNAKTHEVMAGNLLYLTAPLLQEKLQDTDVPKNNCAISLETSKKMWAPGKTSGMPQMALAPDFSAAACGVDISKPYTYKGKKYEPLPGFKEGYFKGKAPFAGALQKNESDAFFRELYDKGQRAVDMMKKMNFK